MSTFIPETRFILKAHQLNQLVMQTYGRPYAFNQQEDSKGTDVHFYDIPVENPRDYSRTEMPDVINGLQQGISFETWLNRDITQWNGKPENAHQLKLFWVRNFYPCVEMVLNDLQVKDLIPAGKYAICIT